MILACSLFPVVFASCDSDSDIDNGPTICPVEDSRHTEMMTEMMNKYADVLMLTYRINACMSTPAGSDRDAIVSQKLAGMKLSMQDGGKKCVLDTEGSRFDTNYYITVSRMDSTLNDSRGVWKVTAEFKKGTDAEIMDMMITSSGFGRWTVTGSRCVPFWYFVNGDYTDLIAASDCRTLCYAESISLDFGSATTSGSMKLSAKGKMEIYDDANIMEPVFYGFDTDNMQFAYDADGGANPFCTKLVEGALNVAKSAVE